MKFLCTKNVCRLIRCLLTNPTFISMCANVAMLTLCSHATFSMPFISHFDVSSTPPQVVYPTTGKCVGTFRMSYVTGVYPDYRQVNGSTKIERKENIFKLFSWVSSLILYNPLTRSYFCGFLFKIFCYKLFVDKPNNIRSWLT